MVFVIHSLSRLHFLEVHCPSFVPMIAAITFFYCNFHEIFQCAHLKFTSSGRSKQALLLVNNHFIQGLASSQASPIFTLQFAFSKEVKNGEGLGTLTCITCITLGGCEGDGTRLHVQVLVQ